MTVQEFFITVTGSRRLSLSENDAALCPHDFWIKYRKAPEWSARVDRIELIPHEDKVICLIKLCN